MAGLRPVRPSRLCPRLHEKRTLGTKDPPPASTCSTGPSRTDQYRSKTWKGPYVVLFVDAGSDTWAGAPARSGITRYCTCQR
jgi:hypothetical protein